MKLRVELPQRDVDVSFYSDEYGETIINDDLKSLTDYRIINSSREKLLIMASSGTIDTKIINTQRTAIFKNKNIKVDEFYVWSDKDGRYKPIREFSNRIVREGHNLQTMYLNGIFEDKYKSASDRILDIFEKKKGCKNYER